MIRTSSHGVSGMLPPSLQQYKSMADAIAMLFFPYVEVVIHDLASDTVAYMANSFSRREPGDRSTLDDVVFEPGEDVIGTYEKTNWDGRKTRSVSVVIRDDMQTPIGMLCINIDISVFEHAKASLDMFLSGRTLQPKPDNLFRNDWLERINIFLHAWLQDRSLSLASLTRDHKRELVEALYAEGAFKGKNTQEYVANVLSMGRATVFKYMKALKDAEE